MNEVESDMEITKWIFKKRKVNTCVKTNRDWNEYGTEEETNLVFVVGGIEEERNYAIGLTAQQMTNTRYHPRAKYFITPTPDSSEMCPCSCYNAFGPKALSGDEIWITKDIADKYNLIIGNSLIVRRKTSPITRIGFSYKEPCEIE